MKILALTTCTNDARYYRWIPHAKLFWNRLGFDFIVHFYGDKVPEGIERLGLRRGGGVVLEKPIRGLKASSVSQVSRLFLPAFYSEYERIVITDVDLLPISSNFFDQVAGFPNETFIAMRQKNDGECYMGFCCADVFGWGKIWNLFENTQPSKKALEKILIKLFLYNTSDSFLRKCSPFHKVGLEWSFDQKLLTHCVSRLSINEKIVLTGLDFFSLHSGFTAKKAYFNCDDFMVSREWVKENAEKIIFYTRDDQRRLINYENEVGFLKKIVNI